MNKEDGGGMDFIGEWWLRRWLDYGFEDLEDSLHPK